MLLTRMIEYEIVCQQKMLASVCSVCKKQRNRNLTPRCAELMTSQPRLKKTKKPRVQSEKTMRNKESSQRGDRPTCCNINLAQVRQRRRRGLFASPSVLYRKRVIQQSCFPSTARQEYSNCVGMSNSYFSKPSMTRLQGPSKHRGSNSTYCLPDRPSHRPLSRYSVQDITI